METYTLEEEEANAVSNSSIVKKGTRHASNRGGAFAPSIEGGGNGTDKTLSKRCTWLNDNVFADRVISDDAVQALSSLGNRGRALEILKELEGKGEIVHNPNGYLLKAVKNEGSAGLHGGIETGIRKRCTWLNANVFTAAPINERAMIALSTIPFGRAMEMCKEIEEKAEKITNPSRFLEAAVSREGGGLQQVMVEIDSNIHKRCTWLNANVFGQGAISTESVAALSALEWSRAMQILKAMEGRGAEGVQNPDGYIQAAVRRENVVDGDEAIDTQVHKRCTWLNANVFGGTISEETMAALSTIPFGRVKEITKELEEKGPAAVQNPNGWLQSAVKREGGAARSRPVASMNGNIDGAVRKRCVWLNSNVLGEDAISEDAMRSLTAVGKAVAMDILKRLEDAVGNNTTINNPSGWIGNACRRSSDGLDHGETMAGGIDSRVQKRCSWLNANVFDGAITDSAMAALSSLPYGRAMEMCKELEEKGPSQVANPSGYLQAAVKREGMNQGGSAKKQHY